MNTRVASLVCVLVIAGCATGAPPRTVSQVDAPELVTLAEQAEQLGDLVRAEQYYASALSAGGDATRLTHALVRVCLRGGRLRSALSHAEGELALHPGDVTLRQLVGGVHLALGEYRLAEAELVRALRVRETELAHYTLALVLTHDAGRAEDARTHFRRYLELAPAGPYAERASHALME